ncbi:MAG: Yip1 domain protein [Acidobacteria bacterium OLB17]|nr:MAG: Yip1 domain protein [Acidobacteria bacterium OLB17]MCZ2392059.1 YIP1 family protein [Acidobacteriota bacterium]
MSDLETQDFQPPPPPEKLDVPQKAEMSEIGTVTSIFIEPGRTFEDLGRKPRFLIAGILSILCIMIFQVAFIQKIGFEKIARARIESNRGMADMPKEQKEAIIAQQTGPIAQYIGYVLLPVGMAVFFLIGGLLYWLGANALGGKATFGRGLSVWIYSGWPSAVLFLIANLLVLFLKDPAEIDLTSTNGLVQAGPAMLVGAKSQPVLHALLSAFDLFQIIGWVLAAIGLQKVAKLKAGSAWTVVILIALIGISIRVVGALVFG